MTPYGYFGFSKEISYKESGGDGWRNWRQAEKMRFGKRSLKSLQWRLFIASWRMQSINFTAVVLCILGLGFRCHTSRRKVAILMCTMNFWTIESWQKLCLFKVAEILFCTVEQLFTESKFLKIHERSFVPTRCNHDFKFVSFMKQCTWKHYIESLTSM